MPESPFTFPDDQSASDYTSAVVQRRDESKKWLRQNIWDEWIDTWRMIKCRTKPLYKRDSAGAETKEEDKSRTNVEMGLANLIYRKNVARLSAQPYTLRVIGGSDPTVAPRASAMLSQQYDRSKERLQDVRVRMSAEALGVGYSKLMWDTVEREFVVRKLLVKGDKVAFRDRASLMKAQGAPDDEIQGAVGQLGNELSDEEVANYIAKSGNEVTYKQNVPKYEGPFVLFRFPGDIYREPFAKTLADSPWIIDSYPETDLWLKKQAKLTYKDPDSGEEVKAFDPTAIQELIDLDPSPSQMKGDEQELRDLFRTAIGKQGSMQYQYPKNIRVRKSYDILEEHTQDEYGRMWITWVSDRLKDKPLGRMPYPWDLYGQTVFTEEVPLPDMIDAIGDSTPRLLRYQLQMFNLQLAQNFDYITNILKRLILAKTGVEFESESIDRGLFRVLKCTDPNGIKYLEDPPLPPGAMERGEGLLQLISMFEPSLAQSDAVGNPVAGKTATASVLNAKSADALMNFKMEGRNLYLWDLGMKKLWMNQQGAELEKSWNVDSKFFGKDLQDQAGQWDEDPKQRPEWALSDRLGKTSGIRLDPVEIQEDLDIEPEAGSYLSVDDQLRQDGAMKLAQIAQQAPGTLDPKKVARFAASTVRGINPDDFMAADGPPPPPQPKLNITFTGKLEDFPGVVAGVCQEYGLPAPPETGEIAEANTMKRASESADHATNMLSPANPEPQTALGQAQAEHSA